MNTLIALVSEQRMQNIIPVFQKDANYTHVLLIRSTDADKPGTRFHQALLDTHHALQDRLTVNDAESSVGAYAIQETKDIIKNIIKESDTAAINFTGGTKCMSIGAYMAAVEMCVPSLYVDTADEKIIWFQPDGRIEKRSFDFTVPLDVRFCLQAYNKQVDEERTQQHVSPKIYFDAARDLSLFWPRCRSTLLSFGREINKKGYVQKNSETTETIDVLQKYKLVEDSSNGWQSTKTGLNFLSGKWLDAMVYTLLLDSGYFDEVQPELRLSGVENELDVMAARNGQLAVLECKTGDLGGQTTLNRLQAIRTGLGTFARAFFVTSRDMNQEDRNFQAFIDRARSYGFGSIITSERLRDVASIVKEKMQGVPS